MRRREVLRVRGVLSFAHMSVAALLVCLRLTLSVRLNYFIQVHILFPLPDSVSITSVACSCFFVLAV